MKTLARFLAGSLVLSFFAIAAPQQASACSCMAQTPDELFAEGNVIFRGTVVGKQLNAESRTYAYAFDVDTVWQGPQSNGQIVLSPQDSATCGVNFAMGEEVIVVAQQVDGQLRTGLCSYGLRDPETEEFLDMEEYLEAQESTDVSGGMCVPYVCQNGDVFPACTPDGHTINYFAEPCHTSGGPVGEDDQDDEEEPVEPFSDVSDSYVYADAVAWARAEGIVEGYSDNTFRPTAQVNRAEFVKILIEAYNVSTVALCRIAPFADTDLSEWYGPYVLAARCKGVVSGYPDGTFRPDQSINVVEAAKIIANLDAGVNLEPGQNQEWYEVYMKYLYDHDAVVPSIKRIDQLVTRGEMVEMMYRLRESDAVSQLPEFSAQDSWTGTLERNQRPADDIAYDYKLVFDSPYRDSGSQFDPDAPLTASVVVPMNGQLTVDDLEAMVGMHVQVTGAVQAGYAETRVIAATDIEATGEQTFCTMDAKMCPDGSYVGREGPDCEFAACPGE